MEEMEWRFDCDMDRQKKKGMDMIEEMERLCSTPRGSGVGRGNGMEVRLIRIDRNRRE